MLFEILVEAQKMTSLRRRCGLFPAGFPPRLEHTLTVCVFAWPLINKPMPRVVLSGTYLGLKHNKEKQKHVTYTTHLVPPGAPASDAGNKGPTFTVTCTNDGTDHNDTIDVEQLVCDYS